MQSQMTMNMNSKIMIAQIQQNRLTSTSMLVQQIQMNLLLLNLKAETGLLANSSDLEIDEEEESTVARGTVLI